MIGLLSSAQMSLYSRFSKFCKDNIEAEDVTVSHSSVFYDKFDCIWVLAHIFDGPTSAGSKIRVVDTCLLLEALNNSGAPVGGLGTTVVATSIYAAAGDDVRYAEAASGLLAGGIYALAFSEEQAGSDLAALGCSATRDAEGWVLNGSKKWCSNGTRASRILTLARSDGGDSKNDGLTLFEIRPPIPGLSIKRVDMCEDLDLGELSFENCRLWDASVIGGVGNGWGQVSDAMCMERIVLAALSLGTAQRAVSETIAYVKRRRQFGRTVGSNQAIRHRIADLVTEIQSARFLLYGTARAMECDSCGLHLRSASMAKLKATEVAQEACLVRVQFMGALGLVDGAASNIEVNRSLAASIYGGTSEIQREIIGRSYGL